MQKMITGGILPGAPQVFRHNSIKTHCLSTNNVFLNLSVFSAKHRSKCHGYVCRQTSPKPLFSAKHPNFGIKCLSLNIYIFDKQKCLSAPLDLYSFLTYQGNKSRNSGIRQTYPAIAGFIAGLWNLAGSGSIFYDSSFVPKSRLGRFATYAFKLTWLTVNIKLNSVVVIQEKDA